MQRSVGDAVGTGVGSSVGTCEGSGEGFCDGEFDGLDVGLNEGSPVGNGVGGRDTVGENVGMYPKPPSSTTSTELACEASRSVESTRRDHGQTLLTTPCEVIARSIYR